MPRSTTPIWILTLGLLIANPLFHDFYWGKVLESGALPHNGDSIGITVFTALLLTMMVSPLVIGITWYCLRRYNSQARIFAWRSDRPFRSITYTLVFGGAAFAIARLLAVDVSDMFKDYQWYEFIFTLRLPPAIVWSMAMRSALIEQIDPPMTRAVG